VKNSRASIRTFIMEKFPLVKSRGSSDGESLLQSGLVDSLGILDVVAFLEQEFQITVEDDELIPEHFESINALVAFSERKTSEAPSPETK
jgi:acyl carrier protein